MSENASQQQPVPGDPGTPDGTGTPVTSPDPVASGEPGPGGAGGPVAPVPPPAAPAPPAPAPMWQGPYGPPPSPWAPPAGAYPASGAPAAYPASGAPAVYPASGAPAVYPASGAPAAYPASGGPTAPFPSTTLYPPAGAFGPEPVTAPLPDVAGPRRPRRRGGRLAVAGLATLVIAGLGGAGGAAIMHHYDSTGGSTTTTANGSTVIDNSPELDRSSLAEVAAKVMPSVVSITTQDAEGSGVILTSDGYILTNNHVAVTAAGQSVDVTFSDGKTVKATLIGTDARTDLAVFKAENVSGLTAATFGDSSTIQVGDSVLAIGSPLGLDGSVTSGIVSALNRTIDETDENSQPQNPFQSSQNTTAGPQIAGAIQTDAAINPGNSGGALVNLNGQVIGINTAIATSDGTDGNIGVGFAIPSNRAKEVSTDIINGAPVPHPQLGVEVSTADDNAGAEVSDVTAGSAAAKAGIQAGDVITGFNGNAVHTSDDLLNDIQTGNVGTTYTLTINRSGTTMSLKVTLQEATN